MSDHKQTEFWPWRGFFLYVLVAGLLSCTNSSKTMIERIIENQDSEVLDQVMSNPEKFRLQILYTQIDRDADNNPVLTSHSFRSNGNEYFYPASTIKLPVALLAMEELHGLNIPGLNRRSTMLTDSAFNGQTAVSSDSTSSTGFPSVDHYVKKLFLVSDNDAFNRLYELLGQDKINQSLRSKGLESTRILHRLSLPATLEQNAVTNPIRFLASDTVIHEKSLEHSTKDYSSKSPILLGKGELIDGKLVDGPKDFSIKNEMTLKDLHGIMLRLIFPQLYPKSQQFRLDPEDHRAILTYMAQYPGESSFPAYDPKTYYDSYVKFFVFGDSKDPVPENIRIFNKVGQAYGFLIDNAYIVDFTSQTEFFLTAAIYVNDNDIFNDDTYEYDTLGFPFMAELGRAFYEFELVRPRKNLPNLDGLRFVYN